MRTLEERIKNSILRNPEAKDHSIAKNNNTLVSTVRAVRAAMGETPEADPKPQPNSPAGFDLRGKMILTRKPAECVADNFHRLPNGKGFLLSELARTWKVSEETLRRHAKTADCMRYVDVGNGDWQQMIMNPKTAKSFTS